MWVWQSQAPAGTSKFTGVGGCGGLAKAFRFFIAIPPAMGGKKKLRRVSIGFLPRPLCVSDFCAWGKIARLQPRMHRKDAGHSIGPTAFAARARRRAPDDSAPRADSPAC